MLITLFFIYFPSFFIIMPPFHITLFLRLMLFRLLFYFDAYLLLLLCFSMPLLFSTHYFHFSITLLIIFIITPLRHFLSISAFTIITFLHHYYHFHFDVGLYFLRSLIIDYFFHYVIIILRWLLFFILFFDDIFIWYYYSSLFSLFFFRRYGDLFTRYHLLRPPREHLS